MPKGPPPQAQIRRCRSPKCSADIFFAVTAQKGKPVPLDVNPVPVYTLEVVSPVESGLADGMIRATLVYGFTPHHLTCPGVEEFRRQAKEKKDATGS